MLRVCFESDRQGCNARDDPNECCHVTHHLIRKLIAASHYPSHGWLWWAHPIVGRGHSSLPNNPKHCPLSLTIAKRARAKHSNASVWSAKFPCCTSWSIANLKRLTAASISPSVIWATFGIGCQKYASHRQVTKRLYKNMQPHVQETIGLCVRRVRCSL
jgi:hypothetical protein